MYKRIVPIALLGGFACGKVERVTADAAVEQPPVDAVMADAALDGAPMACKPPIAVGGIPADTSKPGWGVSPGTSGSNDSGSQPGSFVVGDSLVVNLGAQSVADSIRFFQQTDAVAVAAGGASLAHFNKESLIKSAMLSTIQQYETFFGTIRITVVALGSNDARIITSERGQTGGYTVAEYAHQVDVAVKAALANSRCVVLVNVANHWDVAARDIVDQVNFVLGCAATGNPKVRVVDWNSFSAPHPEWFASPTDIHHSDAGKNAYRDFITSAVGAAMAAGC
jgi:hypothetical protein